MYIRDVVMMGSTMTRSPDLVRPMKSLVRLYCSAMSGEMFALNPPVPTPIVTIATTKHASAPCGWLITPGTADTMSSVCPSSAIATQTQTVL